MIKLITFDIGGTIIKSQRSISKYEKLKTYINIPSEKYKKYYYLSREPLDKLFSEYTRNLDEDKKKQVHKLLSCQKNKVFNENIVKIIEALHKMGYNIATISNVNYNLYYSLSNTPVGKYIDKEFYSFEIGDYKPHLNAFLYVQNYYNLKPKEILHIGDSKESDYDGALNAGWNSYLFNKDLDIDELMGIITKS